MNRISLIGRLTADPQFRYTTSGKSVANVTLAVDRPYSKVVMEERKAKNLQVADFFLIKVWGVQAENLVKFQKKGSKIAVDGKGASSMFTDATGQKRYMTYVNAESIDYLSPATKESANEPIYDMYEGIESEEHEEDIPF